MTSNEDEYDDADALSAQNLKKRRIQRACDVCRRKKIRCDGVQIRGNRCSTCVSYSLDCTYIEASKRRGPPKSYVESLENRVEKLDKLLRKLLPDPTLFKEFQDSFDEERGPFNPSPLVATQQPIFTNVSPANSSDTLTSAVRGTSSDITYSAEKDAASILCDNLKRLTLGPTEYRFYGKSSGVMLVQAAIKMKQEYTQLGEPISKSSTKPGSSASRPECRTPHKWELAPKLLADPPGYTFPENDLALDLVELYFSNINLYLPLLHKPTFKTSVAKGLHYIDERFAATYLLVCAIGARYSDDPRVLLDGVESLHSSGWKWFNQVQMVKRSFLDPPTLYDLQFYCLSVHFLQGSSAPQSCWTMVGIAIRLAQDVGAHRRKAHQHTLTAEEEQWKRGFWVLVCIDTMISAALGRPCAIHDDDFDLDLPVDCDDEYWDHPDPEQRFKQPENKPSLISAFIVFIKLNQVLSVCLRTIYAINKSKILLGYVGQHWEQHIVADLDLALNKWVDSVPDHLRWDPTREDDNLFNQSASCYALYYHVQILIHCPFVSTPSKPSPLSFPSLAICTNAARSCSHIADIQGRRNRYPPLHIQMAIFNSAVVLLLSIWGGKRSGLSIDPQKEMMDVYKCMNTLRASEERRCSSGKLLDVLYELASAGQLPLPQASSTSNKRELDCDTPRSAASGSGESRQPLTHDTPRIIAGSRRVTNSSSSQSKKIVQSQRQPNQQQPHPPQPPTPSTLHLSQPSQHSDHSMTSSVPSTPVYPLPVYSDELGRLPLYGHLNLSAQPYLNQADYWYKSVPNNGGTGGGNENNTNSDHIALLNSSSSSHHFSRRQHQDHNHVQSSHINYINATTETSANTRGSFLDPTIGTGNMIFDSLPLAYIPPSSYVGVSPSIDLVPPQNPVGREERSLHDGFQRISMTLGGGVLDQRQESSQPPSHVEQPHHQHHHHHTQGQREHDVHHNHHHGEQQQPMGYPYLDNDTVTMFSTVPAGFELDEWHTYLSNMSELTQGTHGGGGGGQMHVQ